MRRVLVSLGSGALAGTTVLGLGGRLAMAGLPLLSGMRPRFSWGGSLEVLALGLGYGVVGGMLHLFLSRRAAASRVHRGTTLGLALCLIAWGTSPVARSTAAASPIPVPVIMLISAGVFVLYGLATETLARTWGARAA